MKTCSRCKQEKEVAQFHRRAASKDGLQAYCKACASSWTREQAASRPHFYRNRNLKSTYGITVERWNEMMEEQGGRCAVCGAHNDDGTLHVDHCHDGGQVRGLLCRDCNLLLGYAKDNSERLIAAAAYIAKHDRKED